MILDWIAQHIGNCSEMPFDALMSFAIVFFVVPVFVWGVRSNYQMLAAALIGLPDPCRYFHFGCRVCQPCLRLPVSCN